MRHRIMPQIIGMCAFDMNRVFVISISMNHGDQLCRVNGSPVSVGPVMRVAIVKLFSMKD